MPCYHFQLLALQVVADGSTSRAWACHCHPCRETLRKDNIVSSTARTAAKDLDMGGVRVPAGATMQVPFIYLAEQDPRWAGEAPGSPLDPTAFVPERMLTKEGAKPGSLMPFGHGPRFCIGYYLAMVEMKVSSYASLCPSMTCVGVYGEHGVVCHSVLTKNHTVHPRMAGGSSSL
jgi:hypothetical protein